MQRLRDERFLRNTTNVVSIHKQPPHVPWFYFMYAITMRIAYLRSQCLYLYDNRGQVLHHRLHIDMFLY